MEPEITKEMIRAGVEQSRVDSSVSLTAEQRVARIMKAALTGKVDRALLEETFPKTCCM